MKKLSFIFIALMFFASIISCSKCYECRHLNEYDTDGDGVVDQVDTSAAEDFCTASNTELQQKEDNGYICN